MYCKQQIHTFLTVLLNVIPLLLSKHSNFISIASFLVLSIPNNSYLPPCTN